MRVVLKKSTLAVLAATGLAGCTLLYPRFDSLLNPDIAHLNAGDVVDSVSVPPPPFSSITGQTSSDARKVLYGQLVEQPGEVETVEPSVLEQRDSTRAQKDPKEWRVVFLGRVEAGDKEPCQPNSSVILQANADNTITVIDNGVPLPEKNSWWQRARTGGSCNAPEGLSPNLEPPRSASANPSITSTSTSGSRNFGTLRIEGVVFRMADANRALFPR